MPDASPVGRTELIVAALECSEDAILIENLAGIIQTWNRAAEGLYGYRADDVIGRSALLLLPLDRTNEEAEILNTVRRGERFRCLDTTRLRNDGTTVSVSLIISPIVSNGQVIGISHIARKITERTLAEAATSQLAAIVNFSDDAIISKNLEGIILTWNAGAERLYGYSAAEILWRPFSLLVPSDAQNEEVEILEQLKRGEHVESRETVRIRKGGKRIDVSLTVSPIRDQKGRVQGASHIARDISDRKAFNRQLLQTQKLESIGVLAGGIAHDFNNLLGCILGGVSFARADLSPKASAYAPLVIAEEATEKAADLIHQLLAYAGQGKFLVTRFDLSTLVADMITLLQTSIPKFVDLQLELGSALPWIEADASQVQQIVMNLVINGAESVGPEGGSLRISTGSGPSAKSRGAQSGVEVWMEVRDSGCGMTESVRDRIFDPFFTTKIKGRGLGLAAVSGIVRSHEGTMEVESTPGKGSMFRVCFPAVERRSPPVEKRPVLCEEGGSGTILVVDDEPALRKLAQAILEHCGYQVLVAEDGLQAVEIFRQNPATIKAILLDLTMPVMSGEEAFRLIRDIRIDVPIVISTGYSEVVTRDLFSFGTAVGFVQKPYTAARLCERIRITSQVAEAQK